ncbi:MAG: hypothetical protein IKS03_06115 [Ruminococcus sp.]|nr:hypothetical protein [Ruminococcus sp.]
MPEKDAAERNLDFVREYRANGCMDKAFKHLCIAADEGNHAETQLLLANLYRDLAEGKEIQYPIDEPNPLEKAVEYYEKAAENGNLQAWKILSKIYKEELEQEKENTRKLLAEERERTKKEVEETITKKFEELITAERERTNKLIAK